MLAVLVVLVLFFIYGFNKLRKLGVRADEAESGIDVALKRRFDLIPNLVETVKGYAAHERSVFEEVTNARAAGQAATTIPEKAAADAALTGALLNLRAVAEAYPQLQAASNFAKLQEELTSTENRIAFSRQNYNAVVQQVNTAVTTIPWMFFAGVARRPSETSTRFPTRPSARPRRSSSEKDDSVWIPRPSVSYHQLQSRNVMRSILLITVMMFLLVGLIYGGGLYLGMGGPAIAGIAASGRRGRRRSSPGTSRTGSCSR